MGPFESMVEAGRRPDPLASERNEIINYRGCAATREQAYNHALKATGDFLSAERMSYGPNVKPLTPDQIKRYVPFEKMDFGDT